MSTAIPFDLAGDRDPSRPPGFDELISDLILAWASFDSGLLFLTCEAFDLPYGNARILLGAMDMKSRIGRLKTLASHRKLNDFKQLLGRWERQYEAAARPRNTVCHMAFFGTPKDDRTVFLFGPSKPTIDDPENALIGLRQPYFEHSIKWARDRSAVIVDLMRALRDRPLDGSQG